MTSIWIVHRRERERAALVRLCAPHEPLAGEPGDARFAEAPAPQAVVLGLAGDWELELDFAHRHRRRLGAARWILVGEAGGADAARALFDGLGIDYLSYPPPAAVLQGLLGEIPDGRAPSLSQRARREAVAARFSRWLADLDLPDLWPALDPRLSTLPLLVRGERGSGRGALLHYVHEFGGTAGGPLVHLACDADTGVAHAERALRQSAAAAAPGATPCVWLDELGRLSPLHQRELAAWLERGAGPGSDARVRWLASADPRDPDLDEGLHAQLGVLQVELPPLRERRARLAEIAAATSADFSRGRRRPIHFGAEALAALAEYPWPGNLRELELVLLRSLAHSPGDEVDVEALRLPGSAAGAPAATRPTHANDGADSNDGADQVVGTDAADGEPLEAASVGAVLEPGSEGTRARATGAGPPTPPAAETAPAAPAAPSPDDELRRLAAGLPDSVPDPLATLRRFAGLLPERFGDPAFRHRFSELLREGARKHDALLERVNRLTAREPSQRGMVNVASLVEALLETRREEFRRRHLLVLKELDTAQSLALADPDPLRLAFELLLDKSLEMVPEQGDLYLASRQHSDEDAAKPGTRVLLRFHDPHARGIGPTTASEHSLELLLAELLLRAQGGTLTLGGSEAEERLLLVDLPAP